MIKRWSKFNENVDGLRDQLSEKLSEVRDVFSDFEDLNGNHPEYKPAKFLIYFDLK